MMALRSAASWIPANAMAVPGATALGFVNQTSRCAASQTKLSDLSEGE